MRETIGTTWVFQLVVIFILLFASYLALTINYSKAFRVKNEVLSIIEKSEGLTPSAKELIDNYLITSAYHTKGKCLTSLAGNTYGSTSLTGSENSFELVETNTNKDYYYCVTVIAGYHSYVETRAYYKVRLFFRFDLPVLGSITTFNVDGQTSEMDITYGLK